MTALSIDTVSESCKAPPPNTTYNQAMASLIALLGKPSDTAFMPRTWATAYGGQCIRETWMKLEPGMRTLGYISSATPHSQLCWGAGPQEHHVPRSTRRCRDAFAPAPICDMPHHTRNCDEAKDLKDAISLDLPAGTRLPDLRSFTASQKYNCTHGSNSHITPPELRRPTIKVIAGDTVKLSRDRTLYTWALAVQAIFEEKRVAREAPSRRKIDSCSSKMSSLLSI
jgi:hypothetical protein